MVLTAVLWSRPVDYPSASQSPVQHQLCAVAGSTKQSSQQCCEGTDAPCTQREREEKNRAERNGCDVFVDIGVWDHVINMFL